MNLKKLLMMKEKLNEIKAIFQKTSAKLDIGINELFKIIEQKFINTDTENILYLTKKEEKLKKEPLELTNKISYEYEHLEIKKDINQNIILKSNNKMTDEEIFCVPVIGDNNVGKTCLLKKILNKNFDLKINIPAVTIGIDSYLYQTSINKE